MKIDFEKLEKLGYRVIIEESYIDIFPMPNSRDDEIYNNISDCIVDFTCIKGTQLDIITGKICKMISDIEVIEVLKDIL